MRSHKTKQPGVQEPGAEQALGQEQNSSSSSSNSSSSHSSSNNSCFYCYRKNDQIVLGSRSKSISSIETDFESGALKSIQDFTFHMELEFSSVGKGSHG